MHRHVDSAAINHTTDTLPCNLCLQMLVYSFCFLFFFILIFISLCYLFFDLHTYLYLLLYCCEFAAATTKFFCWGSIKVYLILFSITMFIVMHQHKANSFHIKTYLAINLILSIFNFYFFHSVTNTLPHHSLFTKLKLYSHSQLTSHLTVPTACLGLCCTHSQWYLWPVCERFFYEFSSTCIQIFTDLVFMSSL